jgi:hypothetical protein
MSLNRYAEFLRLWRVPLVRTIDEAFRVIGVHQQTTGGN